MARRKGKDLISQLPDDILLHILSMVRYKEAVRTAAVSRRWKHLHTKLPAVSFIMSVLGAQGSSLSTQSRQRVDSMARTLRRRCAGPDRDTVKRLSGLPQGRAHGVPVRRRVHRARRRLLAGAVPQLPKEPTQRRRRAVVPASAGCHRLRAPKLRLFDWRCCYAKEVRVDAVGRHLSDVVIELFAGRLPRCYNEAKRFLQMEDCDKLMNHILQGIMPGRWKYVQRNFIERDELRLRCEITEDDM
uniref:F-box domain-containing protein n=1 Tax=Oryza meridionalis TaxID=40149 RepID=A0A0E0DVP1_9ORYZ